MYIKKQKLCNLQENAIKKFKARFGLPLPNYYSSEILTVQKEKAALSCFIYIFIYF